MDAFESVASKRVYIVVAIGKDTGYLCVTAMKGKCGTFDLMLFQVRIGGINGDSPG